MVSSCSGGVSGNSFGCGTLPMQRVISASNADESPVLSMRPKIEAIARCRIVAFGSLTKLSISSALPLSIHDNISAISSRVRR